MVPCRLMDTRPAPTTSGRAQPRSAPTAPTRPTCGARTATARSRPSATGISANVTAVNGTAASFLTLFPADADRPLASNLNWINGAAPVPNKVDVKLSSDGKVSIYNLAGTVDVVVDIVGYYEPAPVGAGAKGDSGLQGPRAQGRPGGTGAGTAPRHRRPDRLRAATGLDGLPAPTAQSAPTARSGDHRRPTATTAPTASTARRTARTASTATTAPTAPRHRRHRRRATAPTATTAPTASTASDGIDGEDGAAGTRRHRRHRRRRRRPRPHRRRQRSRPATAGSNGPHRRPRRSATRPHRTTGRRRRRRRATTGGRAAGSSSGHQPVITSGNPTGSSARRARRARRASAAVGRRATSHRASHGVEQRRALDGQRVEPGRHCGDRPARRRRSRLTRSA